jgi:hypothetical protein
VAQTPIRDQDARSLARKLARFSESLDDGEREAFEKLERNISMLISTAEVEDEAAGEANTRREALWYRVTTTLNRTG